MWTTLATECSCKAAITTAIRLQFRFDSTTTLVIKITIRLQFSSSEKVSRQHVNEGTNSYQATFYFGSIGKRAIPMSTSWMMLRNVDPSAWMSFLLPWHTLAYYVIICSDHCLLIGYDASQRDKKMNMFIFRRSRIEAESKSNHSLIVILITTSQSNQSRMSIVIAA